jgi:hypothetical protein
VPGPLPTPGFNLPHGVSASDPHILGAAEEEVDCPECGAALPVEAGEATCETCDIRLDEDAVRDQIEARNEPPEWA